MPASFPRAARIRRRGEFTGVFDGGVKRHGRLMSVFVLQTAAARARLGIAASKKIGGAVERNLASDFMAAFGHETAVLPPLLALAVGADTDNTGSASLSYVGDLRLSVP